MLPDPETPLYARFQKPRKGTALLARKERRKTLSYVRDAVSRPDSIGFRDASAESLANRIQALITRVAEG